MFKRKDLDLLNNKKLEINAVHSKKLTNLGVQLMINIKIDDKNINKNKNRNRIDKMEDILGDKIYNNSSHILTKAEKEILVRFKIFY